MTCEGAWGTIPGLPASALGRDEPRLGTARGEKARPAQRPEFVRSPLDQPALANGSSGSIGSAAAIAGNGKAMMLPSGARSRPGRR